MKTDIKPVERRFPKLGPIKQAFWQAEVLTKNASSSVPGPTQYRMRGFIVLDSAQANDFAAKFNWQEMPSGWNPSMKPPEKQWEAGSWNRSIEFTKAIKSQLLIGEIYFDKAHQLLFFEIEGE